MNAAEESGLLHDAVNALKDKTMRDLLNRVSGEVSYSTPPREIKTLLNMTNVLLDHDIHPAGESAELLPWLKLAILDARLDLANRLDVSRARVSDPAIVEDLNKKLLPYDEIMSQDWFNRTRAARMPQLTDFLTIERAEFHLGTGEQQGRQYDEKFHALQAPRLFFPDLTYYRQRCGMRDVPLVVAFIDIDNFKSFNTKHTEPRVDLYLLPRFMATLEAHVFARGFAYRFGGDEYAVLLPNTDTPMGTQILGDFRCKIKELKYWGIDEKTTVSIGFCVVRPDCHFTNQELLQFAAAAKDFAKESGRDCVATFSDPLYRQKHVVQSSSADA